MLDWHFFSGDLITYRFTADSIINIGRYFQYRISSGIISKTPGIRTKTLSWITLSSTHPQGLLFNKKKLTHTYVWNVWMKKKEKNNETKINELKNGHSSIFFFNFVCNFSTFTQFLDDLDFHNLLSYVLNILYLWKYLQFKLDFLCKHEIIKKKRKSRRRGRHFYFFFSVTFFHFFPLRFFYLLFI